MTENKSDRFERRISLTFGWLLFLGMICFDLYSGTWDEELSNQQLALLLGRYGFAGIMIKPDLMPQIVDVVKAFRGKS